MIKPNDFDILLEALTKNQYKNFMSDVNKSTNISYKNIKNIRNTKSFKQIFGNKQRIWIKVDNNSDDKINEIEEIENYIDTRKENIDKKSSLNDISKYKQKIQKNIENLINIYKKYNNNSIYYKPYNDSFLYDWLNNKINISINSDNKQNKVYKINKLCNILIDKISKTNDNNKDKNIKILNNIIKEQQSKDTNMPKEFISLLNSKDEMWVCISRYASDVAAMSTGQGWTSCQDLKFDKNNEAKYDEYNWHLKYEIANGSCVAYLISKSNINKSKQSEPNNPLFNILHPSARLAIRIYQSKNTEDTYLSITNNPIIYGLTTMKDKFIEIVNNYLEEKQNNISGIFALPPTIGCENIERSLEVRNGKIIQSGDTVSESYYKYEQTGNLIKILDTSNFILKIIDSKKLNSIVKNDSIFGCSIKNCNIDYNYKMYNCNIINSKIDNCVLKVITYSEDFDELIVKYINKIQNIKCDTILFNDALENCSNCLSLNDDMIIDTCSIDNAKILIDGSINIIKSNFNNITIINLFSEDNINKILNSSFINCKIDISYTECAKTIFENSTINFIEDCEYIFSNCKFNNCKFLGNINNIILDNCFINKKKLSGRKYLKEIM